MAPRLFISYSHKDQRWKDALITQLGVLSQESVLDTWDDDRIAVGADWRSALEAAMDRASIAVLLVSADFLSSPFIRDQELPHLRARAAADGVTIYGIVVRACAWQESWLERLQLR